MKKISRIFLCLCTSLLLNACASSNMSIVTTPPVPLEEEQASLIFYRSSYFGSAIHSHVAHVENDNIIKPEEIAVVTSHSKIRYVLPAGKHYFIVTGESQELFEANLKAGKNYYVRVSPRLGFVMARFKPVPLTIQEVYAIETELKDLDYFEQYENSLDWFTEMQKTLQRALISAQKDWEKSPIEDRIIVKEEYGVDEVF